MDTTFHCLRCGWSGDPQDDMCPNCDTAHVSYYDEREPLIDGVGFADPGGRSALRAATRSNPRIHPCPTCGRENQLTPKDVARHYQCDRCADQAESEF